ncbi:MAG: DUF2085 domain-containing protein [Thermoplasmatota archaeon]
MKFPRSFICHGDEERCFRFRGRALPICSRCFGFYSGIALGVVLGIFFIEMSPLYLFILTLLTLIPLAVDGSLQELTSWKSNNPLRFMTGILLGTMIGLDIYWLVVG